MPSAPSILKKDARPTPQGMLGKCEADLPILSTHIPPGNDMAKLIKEDGKMKMPTREFSGVLCNFLPLLPSGKSRVHNPSYSHLKPSEGILRNSENLTSMSCSIYHLKSLKTIDYPKRPLMAEQIQRAAVAVACTCNSARKIILWAK